LGKLKTENPRLRAGETCATKPFKCGVNLHVFIDEEVPHLDQFKVWQTLDTTVDNFAHYKSLFFNTPNNRAELAGTQTTTFPSIAKNVVGDDDGDGFDDEDPIDGINNDMDCTDGLTIFIGDNTNATPDACFDSFNDPVTDRVFVDGGTCVNPEATAVWFGDNTDGVIDDCFDGILDGGFETARNGVIELIDEDFLIDTYEWRVDGITIETPDNDLFDGIRGRVIIEDEVEFAPGITPVLNGIKSWNPGTGIAITDFRMFASSMANSIGVHPTQANSFIFRTQVPFDSIDTNTINEAGIPMGKTRIQFDVPAGSTVLSSSKWRISPDVITSNDDGRAEFFHYGIVVDSIGPCGPSGLGELFGNDLIISLGCGFSVIDTTVDPTPDPNNQNKAPTVGSRAEWANALMHELGHNFNLNHGGPELTNDDPDTPQDESVPIPDANINCKPNNDSTMSYTHQSTIWLGTLKPHFSEGLVEDIDETALTDETQGLATSGSIARKFVYANDNGIVKVDRYAKGGIPNSVNWDGVGGALNPNPGAVDVNFIPGLVGCEASPGESYSNYDEHNALRLIFSEGGVAFDGISACATCINDFTSGQGDDALDALDWYDGLFMHNTLVRNTELFATIIDNEATQGTTMNVGFQYFNCNPNNKFDRALFLDPPDNLTPNPNFGERRGVDLCLDLNKEVKKVGFYSETVDDNFINDDEALSDADWDITRTYSDGDKVAFFDGTVDRFYESKDNDNTGNTPPTTTTPPALDEDSNWKELAADPREILTALTGKDISITLERVCSEIPPPIIGVGASCPASADVTADSTTLGPFHEHSDGVTSWYHLPIETGVLLTGQYRAIISVEEDEGDPREVFDHNNLIFNAGTGNFQPAVFEEFTPSNSILGPDENGKQVTFLVNILEVPAP